MPVRGLTQKSRSRWEHFAHGADIGVRGFGDTLEQAFEQAAIALTAVITDPDRIAEKTAISVERQAMDVECLFIDWLNALIYEMAVRHMLFRRFQVRIEGDYLVGKAWGEEVDIARHEPAVEIKGATYTSLFVGRGTDGEWVAQCVVDV